MTHTHNNLSKTHHFFPSLYLSHNQMRLVVEFRNLRLAAVCRRPVSDAPGVAAHLDRDGAIETQLLAVIVIKLVVCVSHSLTEGSMKLWGRKKW